MEAFDDIYNRYSNRVYKQCFSLVKNRELAKDFTQEIFIKVFVKLNTFQKRSDLSTWLYTISYNYCIDQIRSKKRLRVEYIADFALGNISELDQPESMNADLHYLEAAMRELPAEEVKMLRLKYEEGVSIKLLSQEFNVSESAIKMRLSRIRVKLRTTLASRLPS